MNKIIKLLFFVFFISCSFSLPSCVRNGCTDESAFNYDDNAKKDDCSCIYKSKLGIWFTPQTASLLYNSFGTNFFYIYLDDIYIGQMSEYDATETAPDFNRISRTFQIYLGNLKTKQCILKLTTPNSSSINNPVKTIEFKINANECFIYEIVL